MTPPDSSIAADRPAHYRLGDETWALILKEYREGATAPFLSRKWRVSVHAIRKRATVHGSTKRDWGDRQAIGQALAREAELEEARRNAPEAVAGRLFVGVDLSDDEGDAGVLAQTALLASGRAMKGRLWAEAKALAGLAESYRRLDGGARGGDGGFTYDDLVGAAFDHEFMRNLHFNHAGWKASPAFKRWWELVNERRQKNGETTAEIRNEGYAEGRKAMRADLGLEPEPDQPDQWVYYHGGLVRRQHLEEKREQGRVWAADQERRFGKRPADPDHRA